MQLPDSAAVADLTARLVTAERALVAREKTIHALVTREKDRAAQRRSTFGFMEENAALQAVVARKTLELEAQNRELEQSEARFSAAFEHAPIGVALVAPDGRWLKVNRALCEVVGYSETELLTRTFEDITCPEDRATSLANVQRLLAGEIGSYQIEKRYFHGRGHPITVLLNVSLVRDGHGQPLHFIAQIQDITERKQAAAALEKTHQELIGVSRQAGMAEVATTVLHNVGNVLNSVNVSATLAAERLRRCPTDDLARVVELLRQHTHDLPEFFASEQGMKLPDFLSRLGQHFAREQAALLAEMERLVVNVEHIKEIVAMQQGYARMTGVVEAVSAASLLEDSLRLNAGALEQHGVQIIREYDADLPPVNVERHKAIQVLVNLITNAQHALDESATADQRLTLRVTTGSAGRVRISVSDNGVGISAENLTRIFQHGFTTRRKGHGFGLHSGALATRELGGALTVHSAGLGLGATFTLELPIQPQGSLP